MVKYKIVGREIHSRLAFDVIYQSVDRDIRDTVAHIANDMLVHG